MKIEVHLIQNFAPSCLNRDENNMPKECVFGGVRRARISSQCLKRSIRRYFADNTNVKTGTRTKKLKEELTKRLTDDGFAEQALSDALDAFLEAYYSKMDSKRPNETAVLLYVSEPEIEEAVACVQDLWQDLEEVANARRDARGQDESDGKGKKTDKKKRKDSPTALLPDKQVKDRLKRAGLSADIALFGRMLAENPDMKTEAACQVAHAISTHKVDLEMDFFTAVDDRNPKEEPGAGMMGVTGFNSACLYRYAVIDRDELAKNLKENVKAADEAIRAFLEASIFALPTGKENSTAPQSRPDFGLIVVRTEGVPVSLVNAFAKPVRVSLPDPMWDTFAGEQDGLIAASVRRLASRWEKQTAVYGNGGVAGTAVFTMTGDDTLGALSDADKTSVVGAIDATMAIITEAAKTAAALESEGGA